MLLLAILALAACQQHPHTIKGVKCYQLTKSPEATVEAWQSYGINTIYASEELCRNTELRKLTKEAGLDVYLIFPVFYNPEALKKDSSLWAITAKGQPAKSDWVEFVCPSRPGYREAMIQKAERLVNELQPDGLSIDFIRHFNFWEMVGPEMKAAELEDACYCSHCMNKFEEQCNIELPDSVKQAVKFANYVTSHHGMEWTKYKCELINSMVKSIVDRIKPQHPALQFNLHAVPWRTNDYMGARLRIIGQDLKTLAQSVDYISPMCYSHMLHRQPEWIDSVVMDFKSLGIDNVLPCIQVSKSYRQEPLSTSTFEDCIKASLNNQQTGIVFWSWEMLERDESKKNALKEIR